MKVAILLVALIASSQVASARAQTPSQATAVTPSVHLALATPDSLHLVWRFEIQERWYLYAPYRNDTGFAPSVNLKLPEGWTAGPLRFPVPERKVLPGQILDHVYHGELLATQTLYTGGNPAPRSGSENAIDTATNLSAKLYWLACRELCVPGQATLEVPIDMAAEAAALWDRARKKQPTPLPGEAVHIERDETSVRLTVPDAGKLLFIPAEGGPMLANLLHDGVGEGESLTLRLRPGPAAHEPLEGLLFIDYKNGQDLTGTIRIP